MIQYTEEFKEKVKKLHGDDYIHLLESDSVDLGYYLVVYQESLSIDKILNANSLSLLKEEAKELKEKRNLYLEWLKQPGVDECLDDID